MMSYLHVFTHMHIICLPSFYPQDALSQEEDEEEKIKVVNLELVFGYHWKAGTSHLVGTH